MYQSDDPCASPDPILYCLRMPGNGQRYSSGPTKPRLVVEGYISTDTTRQMVKLSRIGDALMRDPIKTVSNALITISDGSVIYHLTEDLVKKGTYYTAPDVFGVIGKTYF